jgi:nucleotidyltransferase substrate binding protein (TIGR01987 family)
MTTTPPYTLDLTPLRDAIQSLEDGIEVVSDLSWFNQQNHKVRNTLIAGVIQNFEFVYEICVKMLRRQLELEAASPEEIDHSSFRDLLRYGGEKGLLDDVEAWLGYRQVRNITSHTYDHEKAERVWQQTKVFIHDARKLLQRLEARNATPPA